MGKPLDTTNAAAKLRSNLDTARQALEDKDSGASDLELKAKKSALISFDDHATKVRKALDITENREATPEQKEAAIGTIRREVGNAAKLVENTGRIQEALDLRNDIKELEATPAKSENPFSKTADFIDRVAAKSGLSSEQKISLTQLSGALKDGAEPEQMKGILEAGKKTLNNIEGLNQTSLENANKTINSVSKLTEGLKNTAPAPVNIPSPQSEVGEPAAPAPAKPVGRPRLRIGPDGTPMSKDQASHEIPETNTRSNLDKALAQAQTVSGNIQQTNTPSKDLAATGDLPPPSTGVGQSSSVQIT